MGDDAAKNQANNPLRIILHLCLSGRAPLALSSVPNLLRSSVLSTNRK